MGEDDNGDDVNDDEFVIDSESDDWVVVVVDVDGEMGVVGTGVINWVVLVLFELFGDVDEDDVDVDDDRADDDDNESNNDVDEADNESLNKVAQFDLHIFVFVLLVFFLFAVIVFVGVCIGVTGAFL